MAFHPLTKQLVFSFHFEPKPSYISLTKKSDTEIVRYAGKSAGLQIYAGYNLIGYLYAIIFRTIPMNLNMYFSS